MPWSIAQQQKTPLTKRTSQAGIHETTEPEIQAIDKLNMSTTKNQRKENCAHLDEITKPREVVRQLARMARQVARYSRRFHDDYWKGAASGYISAARLIGSHQLGMRALSRKQEGHLRRLAKEGGK